jgi:UTP--glucose-1-phosphate uridylyltransferase
MACKIKKAVFPVAGLGTRFLPATKALPKEMLPLVDKPLIQYALEEARDSGIEEFIFVTGRGKTAIEDHFDQAFELESMLSQRGKTYELGSIRKINLDPGAITYTRQQVPLGLGHAVWCARHLVGDEPFAVLLADDFIQAPQPCLAQMIQAYGGGNMVAVMDVALDRVSAYGILDIHQEQGGLIEAKGIVEKPKATQAPSCSAVIGRYILDGSIFKTLQGQAQGAGGEIQLTDALEVMRGQGTPLYGLRFEGRRYDCGSKSGFMAASLRLALENPEIAQALEEEWHLFKTTSKSKVA